MVLIFIVQSALNACVGGAPFLDEKYSYKKSRSYVFTEKGQVDFLKIRDRAHRLLKKTGAITLDGAISGIGGINFDLYACVDRLVEIGELIEVRQKKKHAAQRIFTAGKKVSAKNNKNTIPRA